MLSEFRSNKFCRELRLPAEVDPSRTTAVLKDGVLELVFAKGAESKAINVEVKPEYWNIPRRLRKNPDHVGENAHLQRAFAMAAQHYAYGKAIAQQKSNY